MNFNPPIDRSILSLFRFLQFGEGARRVALSLSRISLCAAISTAICAPAQAFIDPPVLTTPDPVAGQMVSISIRAGGCDFIMNHDLPQVTVSGNAIRVLVQNAANSPPFCLFDPLVFPINIGRFPAGQYSLQIDSFWYGGTGQVIEPIGTLSLTVRGTAPIAAPALNTIAQYVLGLLLAIMGFFGLRRLSSESMK